MYPSSFLFGLNRFKNGAWFDPSLDDRVEWALKLLDITPIDVAVDIGSGDGKVVIAMAKCGASVVGIEKDGQLVKKSQERILQVDLESRVKIIQGNMLDQSYKKYNKVFIYQFKTVMERMEKKLLAELPHGAKVVSNYWKFPKWQVSKQIKDVYLYIKE